MADERAFLVLELFDQSRHRKLDRFGLDPCVDVLADGDDFVADALVFLCEFEEKRC